MFRRILALATAAAVVVTACARDRSGPTAPPGLTGSRGLIISDGAHDGNAHFFFLPPVVSNPSYSGTPDATLTPRVQVCEWNTSTGQCGTVVASFTTTNGTAGELVSYDASGKHYKVNWKTDQCISGPCTLSEDTPYRLRVLVGAAELGFIDVTVVANASALKNLNTGETIGLVEGKTLPVKFRIEEGAVAVVPPGGSVSIGSAGGLIATNDGQVALELPAGALSASTPISITPVAEPGEGAEPWTPVIDLGPDGTTFATPITLTIQYDPATLPEGIPPSELVIYTLVDGAWEVVPGSVANEADHTVSAPLSHFSQYRVGARASITVIASTATTFFVEGTATLSATVCTFAGQTCLPARNTRIGWIRTNSTVVGAPINQPASNVTNSQGIATATFRGMAPGVAIVYATVEGTTTTSTTVSLTVVVPPHPPSISVSPNTIGINVAVGSAVQTTVQVTNGGGGSLTGLAVGPFSDFHIGTPYPWITASLNTTTAPATITITAAPPLGVIAQPYRVRFGITAPDANNSEFVFHSIFVNVTPAVPLAAEAAAGGKSSCLRAAGDDVYCWGETTHGATEPPSSTAFSTIEGGFFHYCGIRADQTLACWGYNSDNRATPPGGTFRDIAVGSEHNCALRTDDTAVCWGYNGADQRGSPPAGTYSQITVGWYHGCGIQPGQTVVCWGRNEVGQATPPAGAFRQVEGATFFTCGIRTDLSLACWGSSPTPPSGAFLSLSHSGMSGHMCAIRIDRTLACWGQNDFGQASPPAGEFAQVSVGPLHSCGVRTDGAAECWGSNATGAVVIPPRSPWSQVAPMPTPRWGLTSVAVGNRIFAIGGNEHPEQPYPGGPVSTRMEMYDAATDTWTSKAPLPRALEHMMAAEYQGRIYVFGGWTCNLCGMNETWIYNIAGDVWNQGPNTPFFMNGGVAAVIGTQIYITTGHCCGAPTGGFVKFDPTSQIFTVLPFMPRAHAFVGGAGVIGSRLYVAGGEGDSGAMDVYDTATNQWLPAAAMPVARQHGAGVVMNNRLYIFGGNNGGGAGSVTDVLRYEPGTNSWSVVAQALSERNLPSAVTLNGVAYVIGGSTGSVAPATPIGRVDKYRP